MAMDVGGSKGGPKGDINVTPLIDVVLVLLIIFMVLVPTMLKHHTANVPKKPPPDAPPPTASNNIVIEYTAERQISVNAEPVSPLPVPSMAIDQRWSPLISYLATKAAEPPLP